MMQSKSSSSSETIKQIKGKLAALLSFFVPKAVYEQLKIKDSKSNDFSQKYYSQEGEEIVLRRYFNYKNTGFFIDIGAHHPMRFSNTYILYQMGWRGINIDATPGSMVKFNELRKEDTNIEAAISDSNEPLTFFQFNETALNTFDEIKAKSIIETTDYKLVDKIKINTHTLEQILDNHLPSKQIVDFMSIDAEGFDLKILKSNNWTKYKPKVIVVESSVSDLNELDKDLVYLYLNSVGYKPFAKTFKSVFYSC